VVVGWTDPEGSRPHLGALFLGYYTEDGKLIYAGRVGTGMSEKVLKDLRQRLGPRMEVYIRQADIVKLNT
jgi:ATP-dependent DNA ligase